VSGNKVVFCGLCGSSEAAGYLGVREYRLVRCRGCGLVYVANFGIGGTAYEDDYFIRKNQYVNSWDDFCAVFEVLVNKIVRFKQTGTLLDVGSGVGTLLHVARNRGFTVKGVELSPWASAFARDEKGLDVTTGMLEDAMLRTASFDVVVINHVLEHVPDPRVLLAEIRRILKDDGLLVIGVPNIGSIMAQLKGARWASLKPEEHIWHFTHATLRRLVAEAGFGEICFEAKDNYPVSGWGVKEILQRVINLIAVLTDRSEAMLLFADKKKEL